MVEFIWDPDKEKLNMLKHGVNFSLASKVFIDPNRKIFIDTKHMQEEERYFCLGKVKGRILTVRFIHRDNKIRNIGAGFWRKGKKYYDQKSIS